MLRGKDGGVMAQKGQIPRNFWHFGPKIVGSGGDSEKLGLVLFFRVCLNEMSSGGVLVVGTGTFLMRLSSEVSSGGD